MTQNDKMVEALHHCIEQAHGIASTTAGAASTHGDESGALEMCNSMASDIAINLEMALQQPEAPVTDGLADAEYLRSVATCLEADETDEGVADAHNIRAIADRLEHLTTLRQPDQGEREAEINLGKNIAFEQAARIIESRNPNEGGRADAAAIRALKEDR